MKKASNTISWISLIFVFLLPLFGSDWVDAANSGAQSEENNSSQQRRLDSSSLPNIVVFMVDDLGWNQVGYHANPAGNNEIQTPLIDQYSADGIRLEHAYMTPWCGPSRAAFQAGRTNVYNTNVSTAIHTFDDSIGFVPGLPGDTQTIAKALKDYAANVTGGNKTYASTYSGKWGIGGTAWANTPLGMGYDDFRGFWGNGIDTCDGYATPTASVPTYINGLGGPNFGPVLLSALPGYWSQSHYMVNNSLCPFFESLDDDLLTPEEKYVACKSEPRDPPKLIDGDLIDHTVETIRSHSYRKGPLFSMISTALMHTPIAYPQKYDSKVPNMPDHFKPGRVKPPATNEDLRLGTAAALQYLDDLFGEVMDAIKESGQWDNTIVLFTSDNGGSMYSHSANNNYPLRSAKFSGFEGGTRVVQFLSGGWLDNNLPEDRLHESDTYIFAQDYAPTLLQMAGAESDYLLEGREGAVYGHGMWEYIAKSVTPETEAESHQLVRKVSYNHQLVFDVQANRTMKTIVTDDIPQFTPRLWAPIYPTNDDLMVDLAYFSIKPCRPRGVPSNCCYFDISADPTESHPLDVDCAALDREAKMLFHIEGGCDRVGLIAKPNPLCIGKGDYKDGAPPSRYSLWSHFRAHGPFTNSKGVPIDGLPMKCACFTIDPDITQADVDYFVATALIPPHCYSSRISLIESPPFFRRVACDGSFAITPQGGRFEAFEAQGLNAEDFRPLIFREQTDTLFTNAALASHLMGGYITRENFTEWAAFGKYPNLIGNMDSCLEKGATSVPMPITAYTPYVQTTVNPTVPVDPLDILQLCAISALGSAFCPSHQNPLQQAVREWNYERFSHQGVFDDGTIWEPIPSWQCFLRCRRTPSGTAYIGDGPLGIVV